MARQKRPPAPNVEERIRFFGTLLSLDLWRKLLIEFTKKEAGEIRKPRDRWCFEMLLTPVERKQIQDKFWHATNPQTKVSAAPLTWNCCIAYDIVRERRPLRP